ncbi:MAG: magnesium transporter CorA family protein [Deltaproteobacteria bacterium]|nr:magnesium transporter CorA family protein [Deltaproteobacteria bacterium]
MGNHRFFAFGKGRMARVEGGLPDALAALKKEDFVWFDLCDPTREELGALQGPLALDDLSIEDALDEDQVPKFDDFPTYTFLLMNGYRYANRELCIDEYDLFLGKGFLITVHRSVGGERRFGARLDERIKSDLAEVKRGPEFLTHVVLDHVVDEKFSAIERMQEELESAEEQILEDVMAFRPEELLRLRRRMLAVRKSLAHEREVLAKICRKDSPFISEKSIYSFRDIYDHLVRFFESTEIGREMISNLMEMHLSMLNNRMTVSANQTNLVVKRLTLITTIFMPLTLLAGIGGMSEWSMITGPQNWRLSYPAFFLLMALIAVANYFVLRWSDGRAGRRAEAEIEATTASSAGLTGPAKPGPDFPAPSGGVG